MKFKRLLAALLVLMMAMSAFSWVPAGAEAVINNNPIKSSSQIVEYTKQDNNLPTKANSYVINGVAVSYTDYSSSPDECWQYAQNFYKKIWGTSFSSYRGTSDDMLRSLSDEEHTLTVDHLRAYITNAVPGCVLRVCNSDWFNSSDGWGHSQLIVSINSGGFTVFEGGLSSSPYCREKYYTWSEYINTSWLGGTYQYIKYIKWPNASTYSSSGHLDLNGRLNNESVTNIIGFGTADVYINGVLDKNDVSDYYYEWPAGTTYELKDIKPNPGYSYDGVYSGNRVGTINGGKTVVLSFSRNDFSRITEHPTGVTYNGHTYYFYTTPVSWYFAKEFCEEQGGHLVTITTEEENEFLIDLISSTVSVWTGATDQDSEGEWHWITGEPFIFADWYGAQPDNSATNATGEPNGSGEENVMHCFSTDQGGGHWNDNAAYKVLPFVLEVEPSHVHTVEFVSAMNPSCMTQGNIGYYHCTSCGKFFSDEEATNEISYSNFVIPELGHDFTDETINPTCIHPAGTKHTCSRCGYESYDYTDATWSDWSEEYPNGVSEHLIQSRTEYRYRDQVTTASYDTSMPGWTLVGSEWVQNSTGTIDYVASWPSGFNTSHSLYSTYHNTPKSASETETTKTVVSSASIGYIYWHWCRGTYTSGPINRQVRSECTGEYTHFDAFFSTTPPTSLTQGPEDGGLSYYQYSNGNCCSDSYWYYCIPVVRQSWTTYYKLFTYAQWGDWSEWSLTPVTVSETREVETRTVYRYVTSGFGDHVWDDGVVTLEPTVSAEGETTYTCMVCGATHTEPIPMLEGYTVTFKDWNGAVLKTETVEHGHSATAPANPSREGYTFTGWDVDFTNVTSDLIVTAQYQQNTVPVDPNVPKIVVGNVTTTAGKTVTVDISIENNPGIIALKLHLSYGEALTLTQIEDTHLLNGMVSGSVTNALVWYDSTATSNNTSNGVIAKLTFAVADNVESGTYSISVTYDNDLDEIMNIDYDPVAFAVVNGSIRVIDFICGDVNSDNKVTMKDGIFLGRYLAEWDGYDETVINMAAADVNADNRVTIKDGIILGRYFAEWPGYETLPYQTKGGSYDNRGVGSCDGNPMIIVGTASGKPGDNVTVEISIADNPGIIALKLHLSYGDALTLTGIEDAHLLNGMIAGSITNALVWYDSTASENNTGNGVIVRLTFAISPDAAPGEYPITVTYDNDMDEILNVDYDPVDFSITNGTVTVSPAAASYTVSFNANGGTGTMADQSFAVGTAQALTANAFTRNGYVFVGWNTQADGLGTTYADGASVKDLADANGTLTLYAVWRANDAPYFESSGIMLRERTEDDGKRDLRFKLKFNYNNSHYDTYGQTGTGTHSITELGVRVTYTVNGNNIDSGWLTASRLFSSTGTEFEFTVVVTGIPTSYSDVVFNVDSYIKYDDTTIVNGVSVSGSLNQVGSN